MEQRDLDLINGLLPTNPELVSLMKEHEELERKINDLERKPFLTEDEKVEKKRLQKLKLRGRDRIEEILEPHRN
ncbi:MAG: YdcH family protein [bacterium]